MCVWQAFKKVLDKTFEDLPFEDFAAGFGPEVGHPTPMYRYLYISSCLFIYLSIHLSIYLYLSICSSLYIDG